MTVPNVNWLGYRTASALMNLQRTPLNPETENIGSNPKKSQDNQTASHTRIYLTNWPENTVFKTKWHESGTPPLINKLELETVGSYEKNFATCTDTTDPLLGFIPSCEPVFQSPMWTGGDDNLYTSASFAVNQMYQEDTDGDGTPETYYRIMQFTVYVDTDGTYVTDAFSDTTGNASPQDFGVDGVAHVDNGSFPAGYEDYTIFANFSAGTVIDAQGFIDDYIGTSVTDDTAKFCLRKSIDASHGLAQYIGLTSTYNPLIGIQAPGGGVLGNTHVFSFLEPAGANACGISQKHSTECKWYYTPTACQDCWYKGKELSVEITYKKATVTESMSFVGDVGELKKSLVLGSWETHSTVTQTLTLPEGFTRQQVGSTFSVPEVAGYVVTIDDIKLVSVT